MKCGISLPQRLAPPLPTPSFSGKILLTLLLSMLLSVLLLLLFGFTFDRSFYSEGHPVHLNFVITTWTVFVSEINYTGMYQVRAAIKAIC